MLQENHYSVKFASDYLTFEFISDGPRGKIIKVVKYTEINIKGFYNLGFGDKDPETGFISNIIVTNNADSQKVLSTVAITLNFFLEMHPGATVIATGSTEARTRFYRIGISNNIEVIEEQYAVFGLTVSGWENSEKISNTPLS